MACANHTKPSGDGERCFRFNLVTTIVLRLSFISFSFISILWHESILSPSLCRSSRRKTGIRLRDSGFRRKGQGWRWSLRLGCSAMSLEVDGRAMILTTRHLRKTFISKTIPGLSSSLLSPNTLSTSSSWFSIVSKTVLEKTAGRGDIAFECSYLSISSSRGSRYPRYIT